MAVTLVQLARNEKNPMKVGVFQALYRFAPLLEYVPFVNVGALSVTGVRWKTLPTVAFRQLDGSYTATSGDTEDVIDRLYPMGADVTFDRLAGKVTNQLIAQDVLQTAMMLKAQAIKFNDYFINGDPTVDEDGFTGLKYRITNEMPSRARVYLDADGDGTGDSLKVWASDANQHTILDTLDQLEDLVGGKADVFCMNATSRRGIMSILRRQGLLATNRDQFGRKIRRYGEDGPVLLDMGLDDIDPDSATEIITSTEDPGDGGNDATSIYAVKFGDATGNPDDADIEGLHGIQLEPLEVYDPLDGREMETKPARMLRTDWAVGLAVVANDFSIARAQGITWTS